MKSNNQNDAASWLNAGDMEVDPDDRPSFESQAAYLKRLKLLLPGEEKRLTPDDFTPEKIEPKPWHSRAVGFHCRDERPLRK